MSATHILGTEPEAAAAHWTQSAGEFEYRPMPALISVAGAFAFFSLTAFIMDWLLLVPVVGMMLAVTALWQIRRSRGAYGGQLAAWLLMGVMFLQFGGATALYAYSYATEVPEGYQRISFASDISKYELKTVNGELKIPEPVQELNEKSVFLKGYMYPKSQQHGLKVFVLCKDMGECCFGGNPKPTDMIVIEMDSYQAVDHKSGMVSVAGVFRTNNDVSDDTLKPVYKLDCSFFSTAKTSY